MLTAQATAHSSTWRRLADSHRHDQQCTVLHEDDLQILIGMPNSAQFYMKTTCRFSSAWPTVHSSTWRRLADSHRHKQQHTVLHEDDLQILIGMTNSAQFYIKTTCRFSSAWPTVHSSTWRRLADSHRHKQQHTVLHEDDLQILIGMTNSAQFYIKTTGRMSSAWPTVHSSTWRRLADSHRRKQQHTVLHEDD